MLTLYFAPGSSSMAPHIALHEIGADLDAKPLSFARAVRRTCEIEARIGYELPGAAKPPGAVPAGSSAIPWFLESAPARC
jgi:hypothetical protein